MAAWKRSSLSLGSKKESKEIKPQSGKNVFEHPPVFIFTTCASIFEKIGKGLETKWILR